MEAGGLRARPGAASWQGWGGAWWSGIRAQGLQVGRAAGSEGTAEPHLASAVAPLGAPVGPSWSDHVFESSQESGFLYCLTFFKFGN